MTADERRKLVEAPLHYPDAHRITSHLRGHASSSAGLLNTENELQTAAMSLLHALEDRARKDDEASDELFYKRKRIPGQPVANPSRSRVSRRVQRWGRQGDWRHSGYRSTAKRGQ